MVNCVTQKFLIKYTKVFANYENGFIFAFESLLNTKITYFVKNVVNFF